MLERIIVTKEELSESINYLQEELKAWSPGDEYALERLEDLQFKLNELKEIYQSLVVYEFTSVLFHDRMITLH